MPVTLMFLGSVLLAGALLSGPVRAGVTVYRWVDENGVVHFSDQPHEHAQKVNIHDPQTYSANSPSLPASVSPRGDANTPKRSCDIVSPGAEEALMNTDTVSVNVHMDPVPAPDESTYVLLDGQRVTGQPTHGSSFQIQPVDRGQHSVSAVVLSASGTVLCQSTPVTFYVHQPSIQNPQNPVRRH